MKDETSQYDNNQNKIYFVCSCHRHYHKTDNRIGDDQEIDMQVNTCILAWLAAIIAL